MVAARSPKALVREFLISATASTIDSSDFATVSSASTSGATLSSSTTGAEGTAPPSSDFSTVLSTGVSSTTAGVSTSAGCASGVISTFSTVASTATSVVSDLYFFEHLSENQKLLLPLIFL